MVRREDVDFYYGFSRKELQSLCKKYNLPANRSRLDMAVSLASYFERNSLNLVGFEVAGNQPSVATTSRALVNRTWDVKRDDCVQGSVARRPGFMLGDNTPYQRNSLNLVGFEVGGKQQSVATTSRAPVNRTWDDYVQGSVARRPGFILGDNTLYQERIGLIDSVCAPSYMRKLNEKDPTANCKRTDSRVENRMRDVDSGDSPSSSSFEFHVSSEEGISLSVDLNFNPSDWINSLRNEVNVYDTVHRRKSSYTDLGISNVTKCKKQKSSRQDTDGHVMKDNGERSLASSAIEPCSRIKEDSVPDSLRPGQIVTSCVESCSQSCYINPVDLDCVILPGTKLTNESAMVVTEQIHPASDPSMESFEKLGNICPRGAGSELSSSEAEAYHSLCSPRKTSRSSTISSPEFIESTSYSESFKSWCDGGKNYLPLNTEEQEKSEVLSEQVRSE